MIAARPADNTAILAAIAAIQAGIAGSKATMDEVLAAKDREAAGLRAAHAEALARLDGLFRQNIIDLTADKAGLQRRLDEATTAARGTEGEREKAAGFERELRALEVRMTAAQADAQAAGAALRAEIATLRDEKAAAIADATAAAGRERDATAAAAGAAAAAQAAIDRGDDANARSAASDAARTAAEVRSRAAETAETAAIAARTAQEAAAAAAQVAAVAERDRLQAALGAANDADRARLDAEIARITAAAQTAADAAAAEKARLDAAVATATTAATNAQAALQAEIDRRRADEANSRPRITRALTEGDADVGEDEEVPPQTVRLHFTPSALFPAQKHFLLLATDPAGSVVDSIFLHNLEERAGEFIAEYTLRGGNVNVNVYDVVI